jgi:hypothetical protein
MFLGRFFQKAALTASAISQGAVDVPGSVALIDINAGTSQAG